MVLSSNPFGAIADANPGNSAEMIRMGTPGPSFHQGFAT